METEEMNKKYLRAKKRVAELKGFYKHASIYLVINGFFILRRIYVDISYGDSFIEAITAISNYRFFFWWGVGLLVHGLNTYRHHFFSKKWEERKIQEEMNKHNSKF